MRNHQYLTNLVLNTLNRNSSQVSRKNVDFLNLLVEHRDSSVERNKAALLALRSSELTETEVRRYCQALMIMDNGETLGNFAEDVMCKIMNGNDDWLVKGCLVGSMEAVAWLHENNQWDSDRGVRFLGTLFQCFLCSMRPHGKLDKETSGAFANIALSFVQACTAGLPHFFHSLHNTKGKAFGEGGRIDESPFFHQIVTEICMKAMGILPTEGKVQAMAAIFDPRYEVTKKSQ